MHGTVAATATALAQRQRTDAPAVIGRQLSTRPLNGSGAPAQLDLTR